MVKYRPHHIAITVSDLDKSIIFYKKLGFIKKFHYSYQDKPLTSTLLELDNLILEIFNFNEEDFGKIKTDRTLGLGIKHLGLYVDNIEKAFKEIEDKNLTSDISFIKTSTISDKIRYFFIQDPDGIWIEIIEDKRN